MFQKGKFTLGDLNSLLPFISQISVVYIEGKKLHQALENSVSKLPSMEGRFLQVSNIYFRYDPSKPPNQRINPRDIQLAEGPLDLNRVPPMSIHCDS